MRRINITEFDNTAEDRKQMVLINAKVILYYIIVYKKAISWCTCWQKTVLIIYNYPANICVFLIGAKSPNKKSSLKCTVMYCWQALSSSHLSKCRLKNTLFSSFKLILDQTNSV